MKLDITALYPYMLALGMTMLLGLLFWLIYALVKRNRNEVTYDEQLEELLKDDYYNPTITKPTLMTKWNNYWDTTLKGAGVTRYVKAEKDAAGRDILLLTLGSAVLISVLMRNFIIGIIVAVGFLWVLSMFMKMKANKQADELNTQLPGFLFALKANIQASDTNERAILKVIDLMPSPLYDDLIVVKNRLLANGSFREALEELSEKTASKDLKFLCACMIQASMSGSNMINQIDSIQKVIESRRKVSNEIAKAVKTVQPAIWLASVVIPALFFASYFMDSSAQEFWFIEPMSWLALLATIFLYAIGMILTKKQINKIRDM